MVLLVPLILLERLSMEYRKTKAKSFCSDRSQNSQTIIWAKRSPKQTHGAGAKRDKTCASKSRLDLVLRLIRQ